MHICCVRKGKYFTTQITLKNSNIMKQNKLVYQAPEAEIFEVKIDGGMLMSSPGFAPANQPGLIEDEDTDHTYTF